MLNCEPDKGFVSNNTEIEYKYGLDKEKCLQEINKADDEYAQSILRIEGRLNNYNDNNISLRRRSNSSYINNTNNNNNFYIENSNELINLENIINRLRLSI